MAGLTCGSGNFFTSASFLEERGGVEGVKLSFGAKGRSYRGSVGAFLVSFLPCFSLCVLSLEAVHLTVSLRIDGHRRTASVAHPS